MLPLIAPFLPAQKREIEALITRNERLLALMAEKACAGANPQQD
jgi:hypothetical protein